MYSVITSVFAFAESSHLGIQIFQYCPILARVGYHMIMKYINHAKHFPWMASSYGLQYPRHVWHLVLICPAGVFAFHGESYADHRLSVWLPCIYLIMICHQQPVRSLSKRCLLHVDALIADWSL